MHSVDYAISEKVNFIVSTDSQHIINKCIENNFSYYREKVDDSNMINCINQILNKYPNYRYIVLLMPTSPLRKKGMLQDMLNKTIKTSYYTAEHIKLIGHINDKFYISYREQDAKLFFEHFDGNILIVNAEFIRKENKLFNDKSIFIINHIPYTLQIDTQEQYDLIKTYIENK